MDARVIGEDPTDEDRYPTLSDEGRRMLTFLREHPAAPIFRNQSGNRLRRGEVEQLRQFESEVLRAAPAWQENTEPEWLESFVQRCRETVPHYRRYDHAHGSTLEVIPTISRADLNRDIAAFVPEDLPIERLINFRTSGTSGHPILLPSHPVVAGSYLAFHKRALRRFGLEPTHGRGQVGVVLVGFQKKCFTYVSVTPATDESGLAKINLHPNDWRNLDDRSIYLEALAPEFFTGDPISFAELAKLPLKTKPRALLSTSMTLLPAMRDQLEQRFACPVLDLYSMNEAGPLAVFDPASGGHLLLQHRMFVEILDPAGRRLAPGERGEITLTGGFNNYLPLLRYRTGDFASLRFINGEPVLMGLEGRPPVRFRSANGEWLNNIEVTHALQMYALPQYALRQTEDGSFIFKTLRGAAPESSLAGTLRGLFGNDADIRFDFVDHFEDKVIQYTSDLPQT